MSAHESRPWTEARGGEPSLFFEERDAHRRKQPSNKDTAGLAPREQSPPSHSSKPRPGRRRLQHSQHARPAPASTSSACAATTSLASILLSTLLLLSILCIPAAEAATLARNKLARRSDFADFARRGEILVDMRPPPRRHVHPRQAPFEVEPVSASSQTSTSQTDSSDPSSTSSSARGASDATTISFSSTTPTGATTIDPVSSSTSTSATEMTIAEAPSNTPAPEPFDTSLGSNFTSNNCPNFFKSFLSDPNFTACHPFSLLLQTSSSFFQAEHFLPSITAALTSTCDASLPTCSALMSALATQLRSNDHCGPDYTLQNPLVLQAYRGFLAYPTLHAAGCLKNPDTDHYCFADAITNTSATTDSYIYYLPLGTGLPGGSTPTCNRCLRQTMAGFAQAAANLTLPVAGTYGDAAVQVNSNCGVGFVENAVTPIKGTAATGAAAGMGRGGAEWAAMALPLLVVALRMLF